MMDQVLFVVRGQGVDDDIDARLKSGSSLRFASGNTRMNPFSEPITRPGSREIILRVDDRGPLIEGDALQIRVHLLPSPKGLYQIEATINRMVGRKPFQLPSRENLV